MNSAAVREASPGVRIWLLQFGPCWCRSVPSGSGSFDYVRLRRTVADLGGLDANLLIVSERVIDGTGQTYRQVFQEVPDPKLVVSTGTCPHAHRFWEEPSNDWRPVDELLPVDVHVDACISGEPETLLAAVLGHLFTRGEPGLDQQSEQHEQATRVMEKASTDA